MSGVSSHFSHPDRPRWQWWIILLAAVLGLVCGTLGVHQYERQHAENVSWVSSLYHASQMFILHTPHFEHGTNGLLEVGRWSAAIAFGLTAFLALYSVCATEWRHLLLPFTRNHVVICGLGRRGMNLARSCRAQGKRVVAIEKAPTEDVSRECARLRITLLPGNSAESSRLKAAGATHADQLIAVGGDDSGNVETALQLQALFKQEPRSSATPLECSVHLSDADLRNACQNANLFRDQRRFGLVTRFIDTFAYATRDLLVRDDQLPLDQGGIAENDPRQVHLVILGFGRMGRAVALRAALLGHFANRKRLKITVIDRAAECHEAQLLFRYPSFRMACDIEFKSLEVESPDARSLLERWASDELLASSVALCFDNDVQAMDVALRVAPGLRQHGIPFAVRLSANAGFAALLPLLNQSSPSSAHAARCRICGFGMLDDLRLINALDDPVGNRLALTIHNGHVEEAIRQPGRDRAEPSLRDWDELDDDIKDSNLQQADHIDIKLRAIGCERAPQEDARAEFTDLEQHVETLAEMEHSRWNAERWLAGWQLGPKSDGPKRSPYLVSWKDLKDLSKDDDAIRNYDRQAVRKIPALLRKIGHKICRKRDS